MKYIAQKMGVIVINQGSYRLLLYWCTGMLNKSGTSQSTPEEFLFFMMRLNNDTKENDKTDVIGREAYHECGY